MTPEQESSSEMPLQTVGGYLNRCGFTPKESGKSAWERSAGKLDSWLLDTYPKINTPAKSEGADVYWVDEPGLGAPDVHGGGLALQGKPRAPSEKTSPALRMRSLWKPPACRTPSSS